MLIIARLRASKRLAALACVSYIVTNVQSLPARAQDAGAQEALKLIINTADQICQSAPLEQTNEGINLSGDAKAKVGGIVGKIADLGISGSGQIAAEKSIGVLQKDLIIAIQSGNSCKLEVFKTLEKDLLKKGVRDDAPSGQSQLSPSTRLNPTTVPKTPEHQPELQVTALVRSLGSSQGADRYYALQQGVNRLSPGTRITSGDALDLLRGIRDPQIRYDAIDQWVLPSLAIPLSAGEALQLLSGLPPPERTRLLGRIEPCISRPIRPDSDNELLKGVTADARPSLAIALDEQQSCSNKNIGSN